MQLRFLALLFMLVSLGSIGYCLGETADNYRWARREYLENSFSGRGSSDYLYYDYKEAMENEVLAAGVGGVLGLIFGFISRKKGGGTLSTVSIVGSLAGLGGVGFALSEYNGLF
jgi:hypothetical protein